MQIPQTFKPSNLFKIAQMQGAGTLYKLRVLAGTLGYLGTGTWAILRVQCAPDDEGDLFRRPL